MLENYLEKLVTFKTISTDHEENARAFEWVIDQLKNIPLYIKKHSSDGFPSLTITTRDTKTPRIWLVGHMDVVAASDGHFTPRYEGKKLFGRGVFDMKFAIASYIALVQVLKQSVKDYDFGIMLTSDEEIGGKNGAGFLTEHGYASEISIIPDGGENWKFQEGAKGVFQVRIESRGATAHGSRPWEGVSATVNLIHYLEKTLHEFVQEPCNIINHKHDTINVGKINGGVSTNQIPNYAEAMLDIRFIPTTKKEDILKKLQKHLRDYKQVSIHEVTYGNNYIIDQKNKYFKEFTKIVKEIYNIPISFVFSHGSSDARFFISKNIPCLLVRPTGGNIHSENEWIDTEDLHTFYNVLKEFLQNKAKAK